MDYDIIILGGGIAGLTAGIYCARGGKRTVVVERNEAGGQLNTIADIGNYPGFPAVTGPELSERLRDHALSMGAELLVTDVLKVALSPIAVTTGAGELTGRGLIVATGANAARLGLPRETELTGDGVSYCATCDGRFYKNQDVAVVGSGAKAEHDARYLASLCRTVYLIGESSSRMPGNVQTIRGEAAALVGEPLSALKVNAGGTYRELAVTGVFVAKGFDPNTSLFAGLLETDEKGFIRTDGKGRASAENVYAAGDVISKSFRQAVTAAGEGATAAHYLMRDLAKKI